jgi:hypothetical protein
VDEISKHVHELCDDEKITEYIFPTARKMTDDNKELAINLLEKGMKPLNTKKVLMDKGPIVKRHDIYNINQ